MNNESLVREKSVKEKTETGYLVPVNKEGIECFESRQLPEGVLYGDEDDVDMSGILDDYDDDEINMSGV